MWSALDSSAALGEDDETENEEVTTRASTKRQFACDDNVATSSASKSNKKAKKRDSEDELIAAFKSVADKLSNAIEKVATWDTDVPDDLFDNLLNLPGVCSVCMLKHGSCFLCCVCCFWWFVET